MNLVLTLGLNQRVGHLRHCALLNQQVEFALDHWSQHLALLTTHRRGQKHPFLSGPLKNLRRRHRGRLNKNLEQRNEERIVDDAALHVHEFLTSG